MRNEVEDLRKDKKSLQVTTNIHTCKETNGVHFVDNEYIIEMKAINKIGEKERNLFKRYSHLFNMASIETGSFYIE